MAPSEEDCPSEDVILAFIEGRLSAPGATSLHRHIDGCASCEALFVELARATEAPPETTSPAEGGGENASPRTAAPALARPEEFVPAPGVIVGGRYRLERLLGEGGMGIVWAATHTVTRRPFALKLLKAGAESASNHAGRFRREARAASAVEHPNIVRILDIFEQNGAPVLVMDLLAGESLGKRLERRGSLRLDEVAAIMTPVLSAVAAAHAAGVIHRDLKPDNVFLVDAAGGALDVRVLDFGVAKMTAFEDQVTISKTLTRTGEVVGTPYYMAPEQFFGEHDIDSRADVWALGVMLYECLAGQRPFPGDSLGQILKRVTSGKHTPLRKAAPHVPPEVARIVERMLQRERRARPTDLQAIARALQRAAGPEARPLGAAQAVSPAAGAGRPRLTLRWGATAALSVAAAATAGIWAALGRQPTTSHVAPAAAPSAPAPPASTPSRVAIAPEAPAREVVGAWHFAAAGGHFSVGITQADGGLRGTMMGKEGWSDALDAVSWNETNHELFFRRVATSWQWYSMRAVDGVMVGRFAPTTSPQKPAKSADFREPATAWSAHQFDSSLAPHAYELTTVDGYFARVRLDHTPAGNPVGRFKVYSTAKIPGVEEPEYDLDVSEWDGTRLTFARSGSDWAQLYQGTVTGEAAFGRFTHNGNDMGSWSGKRADVLSYGLAPRSPAERAAWQAQTRRRLAHLIMAGNPAPLSSAVLTVRSNLPPAAGAPAPQRDDDPEHWPPSYRLNEVRFTYSLPNPDDPRRPLSRRAHGYLARPAVIPPGQKLRAVIALNDHGGSAWQVMSPNSETQWYGDAFARRGFVVLALDVSHRDDSPLYKMSGGDDPPNGNGAHPSIKAPGGPVSHWEEDGERAWDAMRALDYLQSLPYVDASKVIITGLALGGEVATLAAALDPRFAMAIVAGYSPDLGVLEQRHAHPCWRWAKGDVREYIDVPDFFALVAPRPLVFETGKADFTVSPSYPVAAQKQIARRARAAYGDEVKNFVHYLHEGANQYRVGDRSARGAPPEGVGTPDRIEPALPDPLAWQADTSTTRRWANLFDVIDRFLPAS